MKKKLSLIAKTIHPAHSRHLSEHLLGPTVTFYFSFILIGLLLMLGIFMGLNWDKSLAISDLSVQNQVVLVERPLVTIDSSLNETNSFLGFSNQEFHYSRFIFFGAKTTSYTNQLTLLLLPGVVLLIGVISVLLSIVIALVSSLVAYLFSRKQKNSVSFRDLLVINLHYQAPVLMIFFILYPFWNVAFFVLLIYLFNYILGVILLSNKKFKTLEL